MRLRKKRQKPVVHHKRRGDGPLILCKLCNRKHKKRVACKMKVVTVVAKSGRVVQRWKVV